MLTVNRSQPVPETKNRTNTRFRCVLLSTADQYLARAAETYALTLFDVIHTGCFNRQAQTLTSEITEVMEKERVDFLFSFLCPAIIREKILQAAKIASINFHPAPPKYPGVGSASYALYHQDSTFAVTAHIMEPQVDAGAIIDTLEFPITPGDTCESLFDRACHYSLLLFYRVLAVLAQTGKVIPNGRQWTRKAITRKEFEKWMTLSPNAPATEITRKIKALRHSQLAGPFVEIAGERFELPPAIRNNLTGK